MEMTFQTYLDHLNQLGKTLDELTELAREKTRAVKAGDLGAIDAVMRREQALSMSLRGMERKRQELLKGLGLTGSALSALPDHAPAELRLQAKQTAEDLRRRFELYRDTADVARTTLECNLHLMERHMGPESGMPASGNAIGGSMADVRA